MHTLTYEQFTDLLKVADLKPRTKSDLKFITSTEHLPDDWENIELLAIADRTGDKGLLLLQPAEDLYIVPYALSRSIIDSNTGRARAIICDFCYTWQPGSNAASITFSPPRSKNTVRFLCCGDLDCSSHVRTATKAALVSRSQLRETMKNEDRIVRLKSKLERYITQLNLIPQ